MVLNIPSTILKICCVSLMITAGGLWANAHVVTRPKNRDEQTIIGGAIWSQIIIPHGMLLSLIIEEKIYVFVHAYFLITGSILLSLTGFLLVYDEGTKLKLQRRASTAAVQTIQNLTPDSFDKIYLTIGVLALVAAVITFVDFLLCVI